MRNETMYLKWQRNVCIVLLITTIIACLIGWHRYREERIVKDGLEELLGNMFESVGGAE